MIFEYSECSETGFPMKLTTSCCFLTRKTVTSFDIRCGSRPPSGLRGCFCSLFSDVGLGASECKATHVPKRPRCGRGSPLTPAWRLRSRIRSKTPLIHVSSNAAEQKSRDDQRVEIIHSPSAGLFCIPDLQPDWISHPLAHLCANVTLTSLTRRCHTRLPGSLFPICRFYSGWSRKRRWHSCEGGFSALFQRAGEKTAAAFSLLGRRATSHLDANRRSQQQPSLIWRLSTASGAYQGLSGEHSKWRARPLASTCSSLWSVWTCARVGGGNLLKTLVFAPVHKHAEETFRKISGWILMFLLHRTEAHVSFKGSFICLKKSSSGFVIISPWTLPKCSCLFSSTSPSAHSSHP